MHIVSEKKLGIPQTSREVFDLLFQGNIIDREMAEKLKAMVGFRNIPVHDYRSVNLEIVRNIIEKHLDDLKMFVNTIIKL